MGKEITKNMKRNVKWTGDKVLDSRVTKFLGHNCQLK